MMDSNNSKRRKREDEVEEMIEGLINLDFIHGGRFLTKNCYVGGKKEFIDAVDWTTLEFHEVELYVKSLGYHSVLKYAFGQLGEVEGYTFFHDAHSYGMIISDHIDFSKNLLKVYLECLDADLTTLGDGDGDGEGKSKSIGGGDCKGKDICNNSGGGNKIKANDKGKKKCKDALHDIDGAGRVNKLDELFDQDEDDGDVRSEYESSNDSPASLESDEEEIGYRKSKLSSKIYKPNVDHKKLVFDLGLKFKDQEECKEAIRNWAIENGYNIRWKKSSEKKLEARCDGSCPWLIYCSKLAGESTFVVKTLMDKHTCVRSNYNRQVTSDWLAKLILPVLKRNSNYPVKEMIDDLQLKYGVTVNGDLCYTAKWKALEQLRGSLESHYSHLKSYIAHLQMMDREGRFLLKTHLNTNDQPVFMRAYIGFSSLRKGFMVGCRRCICFDACFLKTTLGGALLAAVAKDCNNKMWPISWAVVERESEDTWTWFFKNLFEDLAIVDGFGWTFMSDKHKGIISGINKLTPHAEHRHCARHIYANWKKDFRGPKLRNLFWEAVNCTNENQFKIKMSRLKDESEGGYEKFMDREPRRFCKSLISLHTKTDVIHNNICEPFNSYILKARDKAIIDMLEDIRLKLMTRMPEIVKTLNATSELLCPNVYKKLGSLQKGAKFCTIKPAMDKKFEVHVFHETVIVDLISKECSCKSWSLTGIPCIHGIACINHVRDDPAIYVDEFYHRANCLEAYKHYLAPIYGRRDWPSVDGPPILPPPFVRGPGRQKKNRRKDPSEEPKLGKQKLSNKGNRVACTRCKQFGHNVRTCKKPAPQQESAPEPPPNRKPGRPRKPHTAAQEPGAKNQRRKELRQARKGYGVLTGDSGTIYIRPPGARRTTVYRQHEDENASQSSQVVDGSTPPI